jgi:hypothetical protein
MSRDRPRSPDKPLSTAELHALELEFARVNTAYNEAIEHVTVRTDALRKWRFATLAK